MTHRLKIVPRYAETDMMSVIHHSVFFIWAESARVDLIDQSEITYADIEKSGLLLPVIECNFRYINLVFFGTPVFVDCTISKFNTRQLEFEYTIHQDTRYCAKGWSKHLFVNAESKKSVRIPEPWLKILQSKVIK